MHTEPRPSIPIYRRPFKSCQRPFSGPSAPVANLEVVHQPARARAPAITPAPAFPRRINPEDQDAREPAESHAKAIAAVLLTLALLGGGIPAATGANAMP